MNLYYIQFGSEDCYVEAESIGKALEVWKTQVSDASEYVVEEPKSITLVKEGYVIRMY